MLTLAKVPVRNLGYYLDATGVLTGHAYVEPDGAWSGAIAERLGLFGVVTLDDLTRLCQGTDPRTGVVLDRAHHRVHHGAFDCTFAAPKSVSLLHALGGPGIVEAVAESHEASVAAVLDYLERCAAAVNRQVGGVRRTHATEGLVAAAFVHRVSRSLDPHLHTHLLVANLGIDGDGQWSALDARGLFEHARTSGALYRSGLRRSLSDRLGVSWSSTRRDFNDLIGFSPRVLRAFSRRREAIAREMAGEHRSGARSSRLVALETRDEKRFDVSYDDLVEEWRDRGLAAGLARSRLAEITDRPRVLAESPGGLDLGVIAAAALRTFEGPATRREIIRATAMKAVTGARVAQIEAAVDDLVSRREAVCVTENSYGTQLRLRSGGSIPSGTPGPSYLQRQLQDIDAKVNAAIAAARPISDLAGLADRVDRSHPQAHKTLFSGARRSESPTAAAAHMTELVAVEDFLSSASKRTGPIRGVAATERQAAHLEALFGIEVIRPEKLGPLGRAAVLVVADERQLTIRQRAACIDQCADGRVTVILLPRPDQRAIPPIAKAASARIAPALDALFGSDPTHDDAFKISGIAGQCVHVAGGLRGVLAVADRELRGTLVDGHPAVVMSADPVIASLFAPYGRVPSQIRRVLSDEPDAVVVAIGGVGLTGRHAALRPDRLVHVVVGHDLDSATRRDRFVSRVVTPDQRPQLRCLNGADRDLRSHDIGTIGGVR